MDSQNAVRFCGPIRPWMITVQGHLCCPKNCKQVPKQVLPGCGFFKHIQTIDLKNSVHASFVKSGGPAKDDGQQEEEEKFNKELQKSKGQLKENKERPGTQFDEELQQTILAILLNVKPTKSRRASISLYLLQLMMQRA